MYSNQEIVNIILPLVIVSGIVIFVIFRMVYKAKSGTLGRRESKKKQNILDSLIPLGMIAGFIFALILSLFPAVSMMHAIGMGPGIGLLFGYVGYEIYSRY
ncbi:hypothetical protein [Lacicoccus qingdaonensis]|uniref:Uncharacterized protein n=1 Tax=Lacicoccus qingdaonensis TaxID=576118 RepID=A0A1G9EVC3_9BACL|nr:hypothetical protein [Salinicoccus qingdaonensis]SDK80070.1 hypothetical protein SAMN05216216_11017 [Salinicoccus qingdaonensis]